MHPDGIAIDPGQLRDDEGCEQSGVMDEMFVTMVSCRRWSVCPSISILVRSFSFANTVASSMLRYTFSVGICSASLLG